MKEEERKLDVVSINHRISDILESIQDGFFALDNKWRFTYVNKRSVEYLGMKPEELLGQNVWEKFPQLIGTDHYIFYLRAMETREIQRYEMKGVLADKWFSQTIYPTEEGISVYWQDITDRKKVEEELHKSEAKYRLLAENMNDIVGTMDLNLRLTYVSPSIEKIAGFTPEECMQLDPTEMMSPESLTRVVEVMSEELEREQVEGVDPWRTTKLELEYYHKDGSTIWMETIASFLRDNTGRITGIHGVSRDITKRKKTEDELKNQRDLSQKYLDIIGVMLVALDRHGNITLINKKGCEILGYEEQDLVGQNWFDKCQPGKFIEETKKVFNRLIDGDSAPAGYYENPVITKDGEIRIIAFHNTVLRDHSGKITGTLSSGEDITGCKEAEEELRKHRKELEELVKDRTAELELKNRKLWEEIAERVKAEEEKYKVEAQLAQIQRIEALDRFAGGIAHDLNNILYPIIINLEELIDGEPQGSARHEILSQTLKAANRQKDLVKKILSFSRRSELVIQPIQLRPLVEETINFLKSSLPSTIRIKQNINVQTDVIMGDPIQIQQIIMNLCKNAADSYESRKGIIDIGLTDTHVESRDAHCKLHAGNYLKLTVRDTGMGMKPEIMNHIFEPFFTNKGLGKGTGMGLSLVHGIVKTHGGTITVESEEGKGSLFTVYLPGSDTVHHNQASHADSVPWIHGRGKILLVDDEEYILDSLERVLKSSGYRVTAFRDGQEALILFDQEPDEFDLVITDLTMPGMTGLELAGKLLAKRPDVPIILCTGYNDVISRQEAKAYGIREMLLKPTGTKDLTDVIHQVLEN